MIAIETMKRGCKVEGCEREHSGLGYCNIHYQRVLKTGDPGHPTELKSKRYVYNAAAFTNEDEVSWYLLGVFMSDGHVSIRDEYDDHTMYTCGLTSKDVDWLEIINDIVCPNKPISPHKGRNCSDLSYGNQEICQWLISKGCVPHKSLILEFPKITNKEHLRAFIRGAFCGDGTLGIYHRIRKDRDVAETSRIAAYYSSSPHFAQGMADALTSLGLRALNRERKEHQRFIDGREIKNTAPSYRVVIPSGENIYNFVNLIYPAGVELAMPRKLAIADALRADWDREFRCHDCNKLLQLTKTQRFQLYCEECAEQRKRNRALVK